MPLTSSALEICVRAFETREPSYIGRLARFFFMLEARGPQGTVECMAAPEPSQQGGRVQSRRTHDNTRALPNMEARSGTMGHVPALELTLVGR
jgi:hypothetical protein